MAIFTRSHRGFYRQQVSVTLVGKDMLEQTKYTLTRIKDTPNYINNVTRYSAIRESI